MLTDANTGELSVARQMAFEPGMIVVVDRGYLDYALYQRWSSTGVYFVTRAHSNMVYRVVVKHAVGSRGNVLSDETIELNSAYAQKRCWTRLRRVVVRIDEKHKDLVFLTNITHLAPSTIAAIYKER